MDKLWQKRRPPVPLTWVQIGDQEGSGSEQPSLGLEEQRVWSLSECGNVFVRCVSDLKQQMERDGDLVSLTRV